MGFRRKTRPGRLRALDRLLLQLEGDLLTRRDGAFSDAPVVDVGLGARPWTTLEWATVLDVPVVGLDIDPEVVERARAHAVPGVRFEVGGFDVPPGARLVRALNVLRDYRPADVPAAHAALGACLLPGGLVVEGSCGPLGEVGVVHLLRRGPELRREGLLFWTDGSRGQAPILFRDRLPRDLRAGGLKGLFGPWTEAFHAVRSEGGDRLAASVRALDDPALTSLGPGAVLWRPPSGVPLQ